jgi:hypothetical protein
MQAAQQMGMQRQAEQARLHAAQQQAEQRAQAQQARMQQAQQTRHVSERQWLNTKP